MIQTGERSCLLAIPCFRESRRLPAFLSDLTMSLGQSGLNVDVQVVDDGSGPVEYGKLTALLAPYGNTTRVLPVIGLSHHKGKGAAIRAAWDASGEQYDWLGFVDADGAVPAAEVIRLLDHVLNEDPEADAVVGSRMVRGESGRLVRRRWHRKMIGILFAKAARCRLHLPVQDTQCGFKLLRSGAYAAVRCGLKVDGLGMDLELLLALVGAGYRITEKGVDWVERPGSRTPWREHLLLLKSLLTVR